MSADNEVEVRLRDGRILLVPADQAELHEQYNTELERLLEIIRYDPMAVRQALGMTGQPSPDDTDAREQWRLAVLQRMKTVEGA